MHYFITHAVNFFIKQQKKTFLRLKKHVESIHEYATHVKNVILNV